MTGKSFKAGDRLRAALTAEKAGQHDVARQIYGDVLAKFPANAKAKTGMKRLGTPNQRGPVFDASALSGPSAALGRISGIEDPFAVPAPAAKARSGAPAPVVREGETAQELNQRGHDAHSAGRVQESVLLFEAALAADPDNSEAKNNLGTTLCEIGRFEDALVVLEEAATEAANPVLTLCNLARAYSETEKFDDAISAYSRALNVEPHSEIALAGLGNLLGSLGRTDEAIAVFKRAIKANPKDMSAFMQLGSLQKFLRNDPLLAQLQKQLKRGGLAAEQKIYGHFALGKAWSDQGDYDRAFESFSAANQAAKANARYDLPHDQRLFERIKAQFDPAGMPRLLLPELASSPAKPIFIVGMPRSGSTLIEQVLASHSKVYGAGEIGLWTAIMDTGLSALQDRPIAEQKNTLVEMRNTYLDEVAKRAAPKRVVVDKNLMNFRFVGHILSAFPEATILHMNRDPMAVCWSAFRHNFAGDLFGFSFDLNDLGAFYGLYQDLMAFWHQAFPKRIVDVNYEAFTQDQEGETRKILAACGLEFEQSCVDFQTTQRVAKTASMGQVRQSIYTGSSDEWRNYDSNLQELIKQIEYDSGQT